MRRICFKVPLFAIENTQYCGSANSMLPIISSSYSLAISSAHENVYV